MTAQANSLVAQLAERLGLEAQNGVCQVLKQALGEDVLPVLLRLEPSLEELAQDVQSNFVRAFYVKLLPELRDVAPAAFSCDVGDGPASQASGGGDSDIISMCVPQVLLEDINSAGNSTGNNAAFSSCAARRSSSGYSAGSNGMFNGHSFESSVSLHVGELNALDPRATRPLASKSILGASAPSPVSSPGPNMAAPRSPLGTGMDGLQRYSSLQVHTCDYNQAGRVASMDLNSITVPGMGSNCPLSPLGKASRLQQSSQPDQHLQMGDLTQCGSLGGVAGTGLGTPTQRSNTATSNGNTLFAMQPSLAPGGPASSHSGQHITSAELHASLGRSAALTNMGSQGNSGSLFGTSFDQEYFLMSPQTRRSSQQQHMASPLASPIQQQHSQHEQNLFGANLGGLGSALYNNTNNLPNLPTLLNRSDSITSPYLSSQAGRASSIADAVSLRSSSGQFNIGGSAPSSTAFAQFASNGGSAFLFNSEPSRISDPGVYMLHHASVGDTLRAFSISSETMGPPGGPISPPKHSIGGGMNPAASLPFGSLAVATSAALANSASLGTAGLSFSDAASGFHPGTPPPPPPRTGSPNYDPNLAVFDATAGEGGMQQPPPPPGQPSPSTPKQGAAKASAGLTKSPTSCKVGEVPGRFKVLPPVVQSKIVSIVQTNPVITLKDFDDKVISKLCILVESYGKDECLSMLTHLEHRMRTKQGSMKNGPGYLDVAVCTHLDMLKAQGSCPKSMKIEDYAKHALNPSVYDELKDAVESNRWLQWEHFDQGIIQLIKKLPRDSAVEKLQEISYHSFKNVDNIKGCIMSILNSRIREDRKRA